MLIAPLARAGDVSVAVAANFAGPMKQIAVDFEKDTGHRVLASFGSTGQFYAQIRNGAPFDALLAADYETPARLVKEALAVAGTQFTYAIGKLVLWSSMPGFVDGAGEVLKKGGYERIAIANPRLAPYGAAAIQALKAMGILDAVQVRFVSGENINQTYQFVATGNAQLGFVALSQVLKDGKMREGSGWIVPSNLYDPINQDAVVLARGRSNPAAVALLSYLKVDKTRALIKTYGYSH